MKPPVQKCVRLHWPRNGKLKGVKTTMPNFAGIDALHQNVLGIVFILEAGKARRGLILEAVLSPLIRGPNVVLGGKPYKDFLLERAYIASPNASGCTGTNQTLTETSIGRLGRVPRLITCARPGERIWREDITLHSGGSMPEMHNLNLCHDGDVPWTS
jgi:hypothetical protein